MTRLDWYVSPDYMEKSFSDSIGLFYDAENNIFIDEDGFLIESIFEIISPNDLFLFKYNQEYMSVRHRSIPELLVELYYPDDDYDS